MQVASDGKTVLRIKAGTFPAAVTALTINFLNENENKWYSTGDCPKKIATSAGGCAIDLEDGFPNRRWNVYWKGDGRKSPTWTFIAGDLSKMKHGNDTMIEGTKQMVWVSGSENSAARVYKALEPIVKKNAKGCLKDAGVSAAMAGIKKLAGKAMASPNPWVAGAGAIGYTVTLQDSKTYDNRCKAIALAVGDFYAAMQHSNKIGRPARVYLTSVWGKWNNTPNSCVIYSSSGGDGGDSTNGSYIITRPAQVGGPKQGDCMHFWSPLIAG